ncbi:MAG: hypothetical protein LIP77_11435, partial [Planctomycetes bacterium]|nr:hypothetical protein [Planctomycetota bacterium]
LSPSTLFFHFPLPASLCRHLPAPNTAFGHAANAFLGIFYKYWSPGVDGGIVGTGSATGYCPEDDQGFSGGTEKNEWTIGKVPAARVFCTLGCH